MTLSKTLSSGLAAAVGLPLLLAEASPAGATASICDAITGNLVQNCGFEGGTYNSAAENYAPTVTPDDWLVNAPFANDPFSDGVRQYPNSGANDLQIGPASANIAPGDPALWQTVTDKAGASYLATFYFYTTTGSNETIPNALFEAQINGVNYFSLPIGGIWTGAISQLYKRDVFLHRNMVGYADVCRGNRQQQCPGLGAGRRFGCPRLSPRTGDLGDDARGLRRTRFCFSSRGRRTVETIGADALRRSLR